MFKKVDQTVAQLWKESTLPALEDFVRLPAKSPAFDADWEAHGVLLDACRKAAAGDRRFSRRQRLMF